ncbi:MAG: CapA family protein [Chloroflexi bacterium]|nr:CapA family protein [Chloroflexota bacterium]
MKKLHILIIFSFLAGACSVNQQSQPPTKSDTPIPLTGSSLWISPSVPSHLRTLAESWNIPQSSERETATIQLDVAQVGSSSSVWIYALVAPFPTLIEDVSFFDVQDAWNGSAREPFAGHPLLMAESTLRALTAVWGEPASGSVLSVAEGELVDKAWESMPAWGIVPFESIEPRLKVLTIDGQSPIRKDFDAAEYPLVVNFGLTGAGQNPELSLPAANRDPSKLTTLILTGVTALTRATASRMETKGVLYPGEAIRDVLRGADVTHISNEVPFYSNCPQPDPKQADEVFCSSTRYMDLLTDVGMDVVELTGNHFGDYGPEAMLESLAIYDEHNIPHYGGGADLNDSLKPAEVEHNGNKLAFIGCNEPDVGAFPTATNERPGAAPCDFQYMAEMVHYLSSRGHLVIATFQWSEGPDPTPYPAQVETFRRMADAGAIIVNGSQAHVPQIMEFYSGAFIHYGLGNLFFDQMRTGGSDITQKEFIDRHVFYDGRYLGVELVTAYLEDYSRPRLMTPEERAEFLAEYFEGSGWLAEISAP